MKERNDITVRTYQISDGGNWFIEIIDIDEMYEAYIYNALYGFKMYMFGNMKSDTNYEAFLKLVDSNIEEYYEIYNKEHTEC